MSDPLRLRAEDEITQQPSAPDFPEQDIRTQAQQSLKRNQEEVRAIQDSGMWTDGMDPKAIKMAKSRDPREARQGQRQVNQRLAWNESARQKIDQTAQQEQQLRAREQQAAADQARAEQVRRAKQAGAVTEPDPATGRPTVKLHPDGTPVSKRGPIGQPEIRENEVVQRYRNDRFEEIEAPLEQKTDPKTGERYIETKDSYGRPVRKVTGVDPNAQKKLQLEQESAQLDLTKNNLAAQKLQTGSAWQAIDETYRNAKAQLDTPPKFSQQNGKWVDKDGYPADPQAIATFQKERAAVVEQYTRAARQYGEMAPARKNLEDQERQIALRKLQIDSERTRLEHNLPQEDGGVAEGIAREQTGQVSPEQQAVIDAIGSVPGMGSVIDLVTRTDNWQTDTQPTEEKPLVPQDDEGKRQLFLSTFQGLQDPESYTLGASGKGYTFLQRNGANIGSLDVDQNGDAAIVLNRNTIDGADLLKTIAVGTVKGTPIYLAEGTGTRDQRKENAWVTSIYQTYRDDPSMEDATYATSKLKELGADPGTIVKRVNAGELSLQRGEALMRDLYGSTLKAEDPAAPATFDKWLSTAGADTGKAWAVAKGTRNTEAQNEIKKQFLNEWFVASRNLPGITMRTRREAEAALMGEKRLGEKVAAAGTAIAQTGGSMLGIIASPAAYLKLQGSALISDDNDITVAANEQRNNFVEASKNLWRNWDKNLQQWTTPEGKARKATFGTAAQDLQAWIDSQDSLPGGMENPDWKAGYKARVDAVTDAALQLHELNQQDGWEITRADLDPSQNQNLAKLINGYALTGDRALLDQYLSSLTVDHGTRESQTMMAELTEGRSPFMAGVIAGAYAPPEEILVEIASTALTAGLSKAVFGGAKAAQVVAKGAEAAGTASRINRFRRYALGIAQEAKALGMVEDTLAKPASALGKAQNFTSKALKVAVPSALSEGAEEAVMAAADPNATRQSIAQDAAMGAIMGLLVTPVIGVPTMIAENSAQAFKRAEAVGKFASQYNQMMADTPGFRAISAKDAEAAMALIAPERKQALVENARTAAANLIQAVEAARGPNATGQDHNNLARAQAASLRAQNDLALGVIQPVEAVASLQSLKPAERDFGRGILKVASGRADLLTPQERTAIEARKTQNGTPYFENRNGIETITPAGRADVLENMNAIGKHIQTTESQNIANQGLEATADGTLSATVVPGAGSVSGVSGPNEQRIPTSPESQKRALSITDSVIQRIKSESPGLAKRLSITSADQAMVSGGVIATADKIQLVPDDIALLIEITPDATDEQIIESLSDTVALHEITHVGDRMLEIAKARSAGDTRDDFEIFKTASEQFHATVAAENPELLDISAQLYARQKDGTVSADDLRNWTTLPTWKQGAEMKRMFVEAMLEGRTTDVNRFLTAATAKVREILISLANNIAELVKTGKFTNDKGETVQLSETVRARVKETADFIAQLKKDPDATPNTATPSPADPANSPAQPPVSSQNAGDSAAPKEGSNPVAPNDVRPEPPPSDPPSAPAEPAAAISPELTAARKVTSQVFNRIIGQRPILKKDAELIAELDDVSFDLADQIVGMPEAEQVKAVENALNAYLLSPEVSARRAALEKAKKDKERSYRDIVMRRIRAEADKVIGTRMGTILKILTDAGRIQRPPNIIAFLARKDTLSEDYIATKKLLEDYAAWPKASDYPGGGKNAVIRAIIQKYMAPDSDTGVTLSDVDKALGMPQDDVAQLIRKELDAYARGGDAAAFDDPDADLTDAQIEEGLARNEREMLRDKWRQATGKKEVLPAQANAYEAAYQRIVAEEGENDFLDEDYMARAIAEVDKPKANPPAPAAQPQAQTPEADADPEDLFGSSPAAAYRNETRMVPEGGTMQPNEVRQLAPYLMSGNKGDIVGQHGNFLITLAKGAKTVIDAFGGAAIYAHFLARMGILPKGSVWNEWTYTRTITNRQIASNPQGVAMALMEIHSAYRSTFPESSLPADRESMLAMRGQIFEWAKQQVRQTVGQNATNDQMDRLILPDTPKTAALYLYLQNHSTQNRVIDFSLVGDTVEITNADKVIGKDDLEFIIDHKDKGITWKTPSRVVGTLQQIGPKLQAAGQRLSNLQITQQDGWQTAADAPDGALVFVDPSYFAGDAELADGKAVMNYGGRTEADGKWQTSLAKIREFLVPNGDRVSYVFTNNFNSQVVEALEQAGWSVLRTTRRSGEKTSHELVALSPAAARAANIGPAPARQYAPGGFPRGGMGSAQAARLPEAGTGPIDGGNVPGVPGNSDAGRGASALPQPATQRPTGDMEGTGERGLQSEQATSDPVDPDLEQELRDMGLASPAPDLTATFKRDFTPIDPQNAFDGWQPSQKGEDVLYGYRGENGSGNPDNNFGSTEGVGLYIAKLERDAEFFGKSRKVAFPKPKRPLVVDEDAGGETIPMLNEEAEDLWQRILTHKSDPQDSDWIKAHVAAAKKIGLTEDTWGDKIEELPRALTDVLLQKGYDSVYVRSGGMEWAVLLAKSGQRFNRTARTPMGQSLYSPAPDIRKTLTASLSQPATNYTYDTDTNPPPQVREILSILGATPKSPRDAYAIREIESATGTTIQFVEGIPGSIKGFTPPGNPSLIFINAANSDVPVAWTIAHELLHVAQKDSRVNTSELRQMIYGNLTDSELKTIVNALLEEGYKPEQINTEIPAFFMADAVSGHNSIGLPHWAKGNQIKAALVEFFDALPTLAPDAQPGQLENAQGSARITSPNPAAEYRYLKAKQDKAGLTPAENEAMLRAESAMGQTFAFDMDREKLRAPRGSVTNRFQPFLRLETQTTGPQDQQMSLFSAPVSFASGIDKPQDAIGAIRANVPLGTTAQTLGKSSELRGIFGNALRSGNRIFIDSGAFSATPSKPVNFNAVFDLYDDLAKSQSTPGHLTVVGPDILGDQQASADLVRLHAPRIERLLQQGVRVILPIQSGSQSMKDYLAATGFLGRPITVGIPANKFGYPRRQLRDHLQEAGVKDVHFLGMSTMNKDAQMMIDAARESGATNVTMDANRIRSHAGRNIVTPDEEDSERFDVRTELAHESYMDVYDLSPEMKRKLVTDLGGGTPQFDITNDQALSDFIIGTENFFVGSVDSWMRDNMGLGQMENSELRSRNVARALASDTYAPAGQDQQSLFSAPATSALREEFRRTKLLTADSAMAILGDAVPEYLNDVIDFMASQREKARSGSFTMRDIVKAYFTTLGSIGADAINVSSFEAKTGLKVPAAFSTPGALSQAKIRPEEAVALWFFTPEGKAALDKTDAGMLDPADFEGLMKVRDAFGRNDIRNNGMREGGRKLSFKDLAETLKEVNQAKGDTQAIASALNRLSGISHGKIGFIKHLLGFGDVSTVDAVQINFWLTGQGTTNQLKSSRADLVRRLKSSEATDNLNRDVAKRIKAKVQTLVDRYGIDPDIGPHIIHHWLWDKAKGSQTTHKGMMSSMSLASPAASPQQDPEYLAAVEQEFISATDPVMPESQADELSRRYGPPDQNGPGGRIMRWWDDANNQSIVVVRSPKDRPAPAKVSKNEMNDRRYMALVESHQKGNPVLPELQRMVDEAAKRAGLRLAFHGTDAPEFTQFDRAKRGSKTDDILSGMAIWVVDQEEIAASHGSRVMRVAVDIKRPTIIDMDGAYHENVKAKMKSVLRRALKDGDDGVIFENLEDPGVADWSVRYPADVYAVFNPSQIKSADPITYDRQGNVIPLSQRFDSTKDSILYSPAPSPNNQAAAEAAFKGLSPIYRQVFQASLATPTPTPAQLAANFRVSERAIENIIGTVRTRIRANLETTTPEGLAPQGNTGRPDLGYSTVPSLQRVDQIRTEEGLPLQQTTDEIRSQADALLQRPNAVRSLIDTEDEWTAVQTAAANIALVNASLRGEASLEVAELAAAYREQGSRWSETGRARQDVHRSPAERHAMLISELLSSPDESAASGIKKAKTKQDRNAILQSWMARVKGIKEAMLHRGIDIDGAFERLNQQIADAKASESEASATHRQLVDSLNARVQELEISLQQSQSRANSAANAAQKAMAEAEAARAQKALTEAQQAAQQAVELDPANTIRLELSRLSKRHRAVVEAMRDGATWDQAAAQTGMSVEDARKVMLGFIGALRKAAINTLMLAEDILLGRDQSLAAPSSLAAAPAESRAQRLGRIADSMIGAMGYSMDRFDRVSKPATPKKPGKTKKAEAPARPMMSDEEFTARQNNPVTTRPVAQPSLFTDPQVLRDLYTYDQTLTRPQSRISFEEWKNKPEVKRVIERQGRMWAQPVSTTTGTLDMHDPASVLAAARELAATRSSTTNKVIDFWRMSILTGPQTAIVNFASNAANSLYNIGPRRIIEAGVNDVLGIIGQRDPNSATLGELAVMARQSHKALKLAGENMLKSWATESRIAESQFAQTLQQLELGALKGEEIMPALGGKLGLLMRSLSYRHMTAADEFFKGVHGHLEAAAQAHRIAKQEKLTGSAYEARITELMEYGSEAWMRALAVSENVTFQTKLNPKDPRALAVLDKIGAGIKGYTRKYNALSFFFPFINTPTNIFKSAIEMSPVGALLAIIDGTRALKIKIARGNMTKAQANLAASELYDRTRLVKDATNQLISTGIFWALLGLVEPDEDDELPFITGSTDWRSTSKGQRDNEMRVMPPMSIRIGKDNFISYSRIEPFATVFASIADAIHEVSVTGLNEKALGNYFTKIENQLSDKTFLSGLSDLINAARDPERFASKLTGSIVTGFVPNLIRQPIREADPYVRDTKPREQDGFFTALGKQLGYSLAPGYAPPMMDVWGNPVTRHQGQQIGSPGTDIMLRVFDPTNITIGKQIDPIDLYVWNWNRKAQNPKERLSLEPIANFVMVTAGGEQTKVPLTPQEQAEANRNAGQAARKFLGDNWNTQAPTLEGIERIKDTVQRFQRFERDKLRAKKLRELQ